MSQVRNGLRKATFKRSNVKMHPKTNFVVLSSKTPDRAITLIDEVLKLAPFSTDFNS